MGLICGNTGRWQEIECLLCDCRHKVVNAQLSVPQSVFDSKEAIAITKNGHELAVRDLDSTPRHLLDEGNPNHARYDLHLFGEHYSTFIARQYE